MTSLAVLLLIKGYFISIISSLPKTLEQLSWFSQHIPIYIISNHKEFLFKTKEKFDYNIALKHGINGITRTNIMGPERSML